MKKKQVKKLALSKETLRNLEIKDYQLVAGGNSDDMACTMSCSLSRGETCYCGTAPN